MPLGEHGWSNRSWLDIVSFILVVSEKGARKTHILYRSNVNSKQLDNYLEFLLRSKMLESRRANSHTKRMIYQTTSLGLEFLARHKSLMSLFEQKAVAT